MNKGTGPVGQPCPITIVGGGLAGCMMAWALSARGRQVRLFDRGEEVTSSKVAAGIINPVTGPKLTKAWRFEELWPAALRFYESIQQKTGKKIFHQMPLIRLLDSVKETDRWRRRLQSPGYAECLSDCPPDPGKYLRREHGSLSFDNAGYLDIRKFITLTRDLLGDDWRAGELLEAQAEGITLFCEGFSGMANPLFEWVQFKPAKGEILTLYIAGLEQDRIVNRGGVWLLPVGGGQFRCGATYDWERSDCEPTAQGRQKIETRLARLLQLPYEVIGHEAAVRPVVRKSRLLCGMHPAHGRIGFFNGLGSKGVLTSPFFAENFADYLCGRGAIDPEVDLCRNI